MPGYPNSFPNSMARKMSMVAGVVFRNLLPERHCVQVPMDKVLIDSWFWVWALSFPWLKVWPYSSAMGPLTVAHVIAQLYPIVSVRHLAHIRYWPQQNMAIQNNAFRPIGNCPARPPALIWNITLQTTSHPSCFHRKPEHHRCISEDLPCIFFVGMPSSDAGSWSKQVTEPQPSPNRNLEASCWGARNNIVSYKKASKTPRHSRLRGICTTHFAEIPNTLL